MREILSPELAEYRQRYPGRSDVSHIGRTQINRELAMGRNVNLCTQALRQMDALDAAWERNEKERGGVLTLTRLQIDYCEMAGVPLRWAQADEGGIPW